MSALGRGVGQLLGEDGIPEWKRSTAALDAVLRPRTTSEAWLGAAISAGARASYHRAHFFLVANRKVTPRERSTEECEYAGDMARETNAASADAALAFLKWVLT